MIKISVPEPVSPPKSARRIGAPIIGQITDRRSPATTAVGRGKRPWLNFRQSDTVTATAALTKANGIAEAPPTTPMRRLVLTPVKIP